MRAEPSEAAFQEFSTVKKATNTGDQGNAGTDREKKWV